MDTLKRLRIAMASLLLPTAVMSSVATEFGVAYKPQPAQPDGTYSVSHSTEVFLTDREGHVIARFDLITPAEKIAAKVREVLSAQAMLTNGGAK